jgi:hypothetical protein
MQNNKTQVEIIFISIKDLLSRPMLKIAFLPFLITLMIVYIAFFQIADFGLDTLSGASLGLQDGTTASYTGYWIVDFLLKYSITSWIVSFLIYTIGTFVMFWASLFLAIIIIGFLTPHILLKLQEKHYPSIKLQGYTTTFGSILYLLKSLVIMIILFVVLVPFYFIPLINIIAINLPFYYFFHKMLHFDIGSTLLSKQKHEDLKNKYTFSFRAYTLFLYLLSLIPFVALILPVFYIIYLGHNYMLKIDTKQNLDNNINNIKAIETIN